MRSLLAGAPLVLAVIFLDAVSGSLFGQARPPIPPNQTQRPGLPVPPRDALPTELASGTGVIRGRVIRADDGTPLRRAHIRASSPSSRESWTTTALVVELGSELHGVHFSLLPTRTARITGTVRDSVGRPLANAMIMLMEQTGAMTSSRSAGQARPDGSFSIAGVAPGEYMLRVMPRGPGTDNAEFAAQKIVVAGQNIDGVHLITTKGTPVSGQIVFDGGAMPDFPPSAVRVFGQSAEPSFGPPGDGTVADDWTFQLHTSGSRLLRPGTPPGWTLKAVMLRGTDITDTPIEFEGSDEISGVEIVLTNRLTHVAGTVHDERGGLSNDYTVVIFADDRDRWTFPSRFVRSARPDQDGLFKVDGLPPAQYLATAVDYMPPGAGTDPDYLEQLLPRAVRFALDEGETEMLNLKLAMAP